MTTVEPVTDRASADSGSLLSLLGGQRAAVVELLHRDGECAVGAVAAHLGISEVAARKHLAVLADDGLVEHRTVNRGRGRPAAHYRLSERAARLFPHRYAAVASELLDFLSHEHGRAGLHRYLRWRSQRETDALAGVVTAEDLHDRLRQLAGALSDAGYDADVTGDGSGFTLTQQHCAIYDVAKEHPEMCAYEAAAFSRVLGSDVALSRRETLASGASACVCCVTPKRSATAQPHDSSSRTPRGTGRGRGERL